MKNSSKLLTLLVSVLFLIAIQAVQKESSENLIINGLMKVMVDINKIIYTKVTYSLNAKNSNLIQLGEDLMTVTNALDQADKQTIQQIVSRLKKSPNNPVFKKLITLLSQDSIDLDYFDSSSNVGLAFELSKGLPNGLGTYQPYIFANKEDYVPYVKNVLTILGDDPEEFLKLNK